MPKTLRFLTALPVYNEARHVDSVLNEVLRYSPDVLVVNDGSSDETAARLAQRDDVQVISHEKNLGYGAALRSAFRYTIEHGFDVLVTIDCDGQHQPKLIPQFVAASAGADIVSGSRYLTPRTRQSVPPEDRRQINADITAELNRRLGLELTDAFCGFKAYRATALARFDLIETGYAMPLEVWAQAVAASLKIMELPVPLIYLEEARSFGGALDDSAERVRYYQQVINQSISAASLNEVSLEEASVASGTSSRTTGESSG